MLIRHHGKKETWGSLPANASHWAPAADGSAIVASDKTCVAIDFSGASGAAPTPKAQGDKVVVGRRTGYCMR